MATGAMLALVVVLAQAAATADKPAETVAAAEPAKAEKAEKPKKTCVEEQQMGSHFKKRICATEEEWTKRREKDAANMSRARANTR